MKKSASRIVGLVMLIIAVAFIMFAVNHPEMSFPWNNTITWLLYGLYVLVTVVLLIAPKMKKEKIPVYTAKPPPYVPGRNTGRGSFIALIQISAQSSG